MSPAPVFVRIPGSHHPGTRLRLVPGFRDPGSVLILGQVTQYGNPYLICLAKYPNQNGVILFLSDNQWFKLLSSDSHLLASPLRVICCHCHCEITPQKSLHCAIKNDCNNYFVCFSMSTSWMSEVTELFLARVRMVLFMLPGTWTHKFVLLSKKCPKNTQSKWLWSNHPKTVKCHYNTDASLNMVYVWLSNCTHITSNPHWAAGHMGLRHAIIAL